MKTFFSLFGALAVCFALVGCGDKGGCEEGKCTTCKCDKACECGKGKCCCGGVCKTKCDCHGCCCGK